MTKTANLRGFMVNPSGPPVEVQSERTAKSFWSASAVAVIVAVFVAYAPWLAAHAQGLWLRPPYEFFPFVLAGSGALAIRALRAGGKLAPGPRLLSWLLAAVSVVLLVVAALLYSPLTGAISALLLLAAGAIAVGGWPLARRLGPAWVFLWLAVPPPLNVHEELVAAIQSHTARWAGAVLDQLRVFHLVTGNVVEIAGRRFEVENACGGVSALAAVVALTLFSAMWRRYSAFRTLRLVASGIVFVLLANVACVAASVLITTRTELDLTAGWRYEALGLAFFVLALGLVWSADRFVLFITAPLPITPEQMLRQINTGPDAEQPARPVNQPVRVAKVVMPDLRGTWLASWTMAAVCLTVAVGQFVAFPHHFGVNASQVDDSLTARLDAFGEQAMPDYWGDWPRGKFEAETRSAGNALGQFSRRWSYQAGRSTAAVEVDYPFAGSHDLAACYRAQGWTMGERLKDESVGPQDRGSLPTAIAMTKGHYHALLLFQILGADDDRPLPIQERRGAAKFLFRLGGRFELPAERQVSKPAYRVQLFLQGFAPPSDADRAQARGLLQLARETFSRPSAPRGKDVP